VVWLACVSHSDQYDDIVKFEKHFFKWMTPIVDTIKVMTLHVSKGLEFPVVALVGAGHMPAPGEDEREEAKLFYVGATRRLIVGMGGEGRFGQRLAA